MSPSDLEATIDSLGSQLAVWTAIVALGLLIEYARPIKDFVVSCFRWVFRSGLRPSLSHVVVGGLLITIGVTMECSIEYRASRAETELRVLLGPRHLTFAQQNALADACRPFAGSEVTILSYVMDAEGVSFAAQIKEALKPCHLAVNDQIATLITTRGVAQGIHIDAAGSSLALGRALAESFSKFTTPVFFPPESGTPRPREVILMVGVKPYPRLD
jgi:hypothetical protein